MDASTAMVESGLLRVSLSWCAATHTGHRRPLNEDSFLAESPVFVVADGMGGHEGGEIASALAVATMRNLLELERVEVRDVVQVVEAANSSVFGMSADTSRPMGTTLTGLVVVAASHGCEAAVVNVGDSRTYRWRAHRLEQVTTDHSYVQDLVEAGLLGADDAEVHPERNVVTRALGIDPIVDVDVISTELRAGDRFLLCSDGLSGELDFDRIARCLAEGDAAGAAERLMAEVLAGPARDNVSVIVLDIERVERHDDPDRTDPRGTRQRAAIIDEVPGFIRLARPNEAGSVQ